MIRKTIEPVEGKVVIDPWGRRITSRARVPWNSFWQRRLNEGAITVVEEQAEADKPKRARKKQESKPETEAEE